jgi:hypothetical protein
LSSPSNLFRALRWLAAAAAGLSLLPVLAQERIYRCGNEYTNNAELARSRACTVMEGGNITVVQGTVPSRATETRSAATVPPRTPPPATAPRPAGERVDAAAQRARDSDARAILQIELRRAEERLAQAQQEYANGEPEKQGIESRNHQRYLDRVAALKASVARAQVDVDSLRRELGRLAGSPAASATSAAK